MMTVLTQEEIASLNPDDEIVVTMSPDEFVTFTYLIIVATALAEYAPKAARETFLEGLAKLRPGEDVVQFMRRLLHSSEVITLDWLDKKRAEFP